MYKAFKYRLYPNKNQLRELEIMRETLRRLYNECLEWKQFAWEQYRATITFYDFCRWFTHERSRNPFYQRISVTAARGVFQRLVQAFQTFFDRVKAGKPPGFPRFKGRAQYGSILFPQYAGSGARLIDHRLKMLHVGSIKVKLHRPVEGTIKVCAVKEEAGRWFLSLTCKLPDVVPEPSKLPPCGIDLGLEAFLTTSDGYREPNPRFLRNELPLVRRLSRSMNRKKKGGANRRKTASRLSRLYARVRDLRLDHRHKTALKLIRCYGFIAVEALQIINLVRNNRLARAILDAGWSGFVTTLKRKAASAGVQVVEVEPCGTSMECSQCKGEVPKELRQRQHKCPHCGLSLHRDHNAALNILARGLAGARPAGANVGQQAKRPPRSRRKAV